MGAFRTSCASLNWSLPGDKPAFGGASPHQKFPFPAQAETGSMTGWWVPSLSPTTSTTGAVAGLVGIECGVVSGVINLESSGVEASDWRPRHDEHCLIGPHRVAQVEC